MWESSMEIHINARGYTSPVGVQHGNTHSHKGIYNLCGIPAWKRTLTQEDIQALWESSGSPTWTHEGTVGIHYGNTHSHKRIYKLCWSPVGVQHGRTKALWESIMETHIHTRGYTSSVGVQWESNMD